MPRLPWDPVLVAWDVRVMVLWEFKLELVCWRVVEWWAGLLLLFCYCLWLVGLGTLTRHTHKRDHSQPSLEGHDMWASIFDTMPLPMVDSRSRTCSKLRGSSSLEWLSLRNLSPYCMPSWISVFCNRYFGSFSILVLLFLLRDYMPFCTLGLINPWDPLEDVNKGFFFCFFWCGLSCRRVSFGQSVNVLSVD